MFLLGPLILLPRCNRPLLVFMELHTKYRLRAASIAPQNVAFMKTAYILKIRLYIKFRSPTHCCSRLNKFTPLRRHVRTIDDTALKYRTMG